MSSSDDNLMLYSAVLKAAIAVHAIDSTDWLRRFNKSSDEQNWRELLLLLPLFFFFFALFTTHISSMQPRSSVCVSPSSARTLRSVQRHTASLKGYALDMTRYCKHHL